MLSLRSSQHPPGHLHDATLVGKWRHDTSAEHHLDPPKPVTGVLPAFGARGGHLPHPPRPGRRLPRTPAAQQNDRTAVAARNVATPQGDPPDCCSRVSEISGVKPPTTAETW